MISSQGCSIQTFLGQKFSETCEKELLKGENSDKGNIKFNSLFFGPTSVF
jgi:hypothetical protein